MTDRSDAGSAGALHDYLFRVAARRPDRVAAVIGAARITYAELAQRVLGLSAVFSKSGVTPGDRVLVLGENSLETLLGFWAALAASAVPVLVSPLARTARIAYLLSDTRASALLAASALAPNWLESAAGAPALKAVVVTGDLPPEKTSRLPNAISLSAISSSAAVSMPQARCAPEDLAALIYTSGSTGEPKGVMHTHGSLRAAADSIASYLDLREEDVVLGALPFAFGYGLFQAIASAAVGATLVVERGYAFPAHVLGRIAEERVTCVALVPPVLAMLGAFKTIDDFDRSSVRIVTSAAAALSARNAEVARRTFPNARVFAMYGQTECIRATYLPPELLDEKPTSIGIPIPNAEAWIVDEQDRPVGPGVVGELVVRGPNLMRGYWERAEETEKKLRPGPLPGERVLYTGDLARHDEDGHFHFVSRTDDVVKSRGEKVAPAEVEAVIGELAGVREVAVIAVEDELLGHALKAFVVKEPALELRPRDVQIHCQARLEAFMVPKHVIFTDDLPKTTTGKILKRGLS